MALYDRLIELTKTTPPLVSMKTDGVHELFCYTKDAFFGGSWTDDLKLARGLIFRDGVLINKPLKKIFNMNENEETNVDRLLDLIDSEYYEIMDKSNGHLFIITAYHHEGEVQIVYSTKGSLPNPDNELLNNDITLFKEKYENGLKRELSDIFLYSSAKAVTICTEAIVEHDRHTMYDLQVQEYGEDTFVVLGVSIDDHECGRNFMETFAQSVNLPCVKFYDEESAGVGRDVACGNFTNLLQRTGVEGYVVWFPRLQFRAKFKTTEYWKLRFMNEFSAERILEIFRGGGDDRLRHRLPEEIADQVIDIVGNYFRDFVVYQIVKIHQLTDDDFKLSGKELFGNDQLSMSQKHYLANPVNMPERSKSNQDIRAQFEQFMLENLSNTFEEELQDIVSILGEG